ncbi:MAG TPA: TlpA disulfide reductase family protein [Pedobacter sp.]|uniref:TlpA family protein disulfide reductase n=1 Tax=Pedobacter sp. TaxID=1411316 RepID=UPI002CCD6836|nr:TlpA disulfide reductase family protein [Pedobacter sp.]HMI01648.1 TlpA disulfide reductase family protein [Pedobacter sp.]
MKYLLFYLAFLTTSLCYAQKLKLRKGQKFTYEYLTLRSTLYSAQHKSLSLSAYQFEVVNTKNNTYSMKMQLTRRINYSSHNGRIRDTFDPSASAAKDISSVIDAVLTKSPITFSMDTAGKMIKIDGLDSLAARMTRQAAAEKIPENKYGTSNKDFIVYSTLPDIFTKQIHLAFRRSNRAKSDTTFRLFVAGKTDDSITVKKETIVDAGSGVTNFIYKDSLSQGNIPGKTSRHEDQDAWWYSLKSSNIAGLKSTTDLLEEFSRQTDLKNYNTPAKKVVRAVEDLYTWYGNSKGKLGIDDIARQKLDSLSKLVKPDDHEFNAAAIDLLSYFDYEAKMQLVEKTPVEYLRQDFTVADKVKKEYQSRNTAGFVHALNIMFTKFSRDGNYPLNTSHVADLIHLDICKDICSTNTSKADMLKIQEMVTAVQKLNIPKLSSLFDGTAPFIAATLASSPQEIEGLANDRFNSLFDNYGRYRLLIYDRMTSLKVPDSIRAAYLDYSIEMFRNHIEEYSKPFAGDQREQFFHRFHIAPRRLVLRKQLADAYYRKSIIEPKNKVKYLQLASDYLPTQEDQIEDKYIVTAEYPFLPEMNYTELYLNAAGATGISPEEMLKKYVDMVIVEPDRYTILKEKYNKAYPNGDFKSFFKLALKEKLPASPKFSLKDRSGTEISNTANKGKFLFIDFWGTWCGACVAEIHKIEDLHLNNPVPDKLNVTTIACYDKKNLVDEFMDKKKFSYQVLMSDDKVEKNFKVQSYPTKLLLLPNDVYLMIPFSDDYKTVVKKYTSWEL